MALTKRETRLRIKKRIRRRISGTAARPRMTVFRSNKQIYVQFVNDDEGKTLASASSRAASIVEQGSMSKVAQAQQVGRLAAEVAKAANISEVVFDRNGYQYHGRVKALAEAAREGGLIF
ncbi:MAG: 50S ribosomal protein L18 [Bacteroidetes bacterium]|nr:MAG: 50S ribosomal protein L18 [Bacteroidota bacterium]